MHTREKTIQIERAIFTSTNFEFFSVNFFNKFKRFIGHILQFGCVHRFGVFHIRKSDSSDVSTRAHANTQTHILAVQINVFSKPLPMAIYSCCSLFTNTLDLHKFAVSLGV